jgi:hypothetical protein
VTDDPVQDYMNARVEFAKTLADAYRQHGKDPEVFVAGAQYALDKILGGYERTGFNDASLRYLHSLAIDILEKAKKGEPQ